MPRWLWVLLLGLLAGLWWVDQRGSAPMAATSLTGSAVLCPPPLAFFDINQPRQSDVAGSMAPFRMGAATVSPLAGLSLQARVLVLVCSIETR